MAKVPPGQPGYRMPGFQSPVPPTLTHKACSVKKSTDTPHQALPSLHGVFIMLPMSEIF